MATANIKVVFPSEMQAQADAFFARLRKFVPANVAANSVTDQHVVPERDNNGKPTGNHSFTITGTTS
jgi:hypothetical protein